MESKRIPISLAKTPETPNQQDEKSQLYPYVFTLRKALKQWAGRTESVKVQKKVLIHYLKLGPLPRT